MALRRILQRESGRLLPIQVSFPTASFSDKFDQKERAAEKSYFNKEDERALRKLLQKMKSQTDVHDHKGSKDHLEHDVAGLKKIPGLYLTDDLAKALIKWKQDH
uniref:Uncharacterized protein AlNc14C3G462 n=1 Tax=Albugo laibachii Nc14 TaxID=890382 RepID=F0VZY4_9STRA|nr:conserved hypothetical protein [Albugo laibachii Nc14]|eukprot:CCA14355.1 conserved hypothetical protein [Albugo laibachii Nc14]